jgi:hypothetical protein
VEKGRNVISHIDFSRGNITLGKQCSINFCIICLFSHLAFGQSTDEIYVVHVTASWKNPLLRHLESQSM